MTQKSTLQIQLGQCQMEFANQEAAIRSKYAGLKLPHDSLVLSEREKNAAELAKITADYKLKVDGIGEKMRALDDDQRRVTGNFESQQVKLRKDKAELMYRMARVDSNVRTFSAISFRSYARHVLLPW